MELKDVILSTLAELEESVQQTSVMLVQESIVSYKSPVVEEVSEPIKLHPKIFSDSLISAVSSARHEDEERLLEGVRERLLVLFEGFQSPNNVQIEAKVDLTLNFLEYLLATIDNRLESFKENK
ncbi:MAG: hypothetical protein WCW84_09800 [Sulfurimonas sp.]|jgi:hypothetical protein